MTNEELYQKYKKQFKYAEVIAIDYYKQPKHTNAFKSISMDYTDVKQEIFLEALRIIQEYEIKYKDNPKVYLELMLKRAVFFKLYKLLRDDENNIFIPLLSEDEQEQLNLTPIQKKSSNWCDVEHDEQQREHKKFKHEPPKINPNLIPSTKQKNHFTSIEVKDILKQYCKKGIEYKILFMKIVQSCTLKEIQKEVKLSRPRILQIYNKVVASLKKKEKRLANYLGTKELQ